MASRKKNDTNGTNGAPKPKIRKRPERMGPDFFDLLLDHLEIIAQARGELERVGDDFAQATAPETAQIEGTVEDKALRVVGAARRLDVAVSNARTVLRGTTFSGIAIDRFKARLDQAEQASRAGWVLVEDRF